MEKFKREVTSKMSTCLSLDQLRKLDEVLSITLTRYEMKEVTTEIAIYQGRLPEEIKMFLVSKSINGLAKNSLIHYKRNLTHFALNITKDIKEVTANEIRFYLLSYQQMYDVKKSTLDDKRRVLSSFYNWMVKEDIILKSPMIKVDQIKHESAIREPLTSLELEQIRNITETPREKAILELLYSTGCRVSEITTLDKRDIDFSNGRVKVLGKGSKERYCFLNAKSQVALKKYLFGRTDDNEALFVATRKPYNRLGKRSIEKEISRLGEKAKIERSVYPHLIRHTTATHMLANGASLSEVQMVLGHESPETTLIYAKQDIATLQSVHRRCII